MKEYVWKVKETSINEETEQETSFTHTVRLSCSYLTGKAVIMIDGTEFNISTRPFGLRGTNQVFRLGELAAVIDFPKKGAPQIVVGGKSLQAGEYYEA